MPNSLTTEGTKSAVLQGIILNYRMGPRTQKPKECLVRFSSIKSAREAARLVGRKVVCHVGKRKCRGKIVALHGKNGVVRAHFRKGLPGEALASYVEIIG